MLYSTKRKLHNLINGPPPAAPPAPPVEPPSIPPPESPSDLADAHKKRKIGLPSRSRPSIRAVSPGGSVKSTVSASSALVGSPLKNSHTHSNLNEPLQTPAYAPWDRAAFLERLRSYSVDKWSAKPALVNEVVWAKRGWVCTEKNRVRCTVCMKEMVVKVEVDEEVDPDTARAIVERYGTMIISEHEDSCLWKKRGCDETIYRLQLANPTVSRPAFTERYSSLIRVRNEIPPSLSHPEIDLCSIKHSSEDTDNGPIFESAVILALFGWQNEDPGIPSLVTCSACFRRLGLWLFRKKAKADDIMDEDSDDGEEEASVSRLDVIGEHREYCPWINAASQGKEEGWKMLLQVLQQNPKPASSALSTYSTVSSVPQEREERSATPAERDAEDDSKLKKLQRLKSLYFGKGKKKPKTKEMFVGKERDDAGKS